jgi:putative FmdB family regulatory protein
MPIYEYLCRVCDRRFERYVQAFAQAVACPSCNAPDVEKLLSTFAMAGGRTAAASQEATGGGCCGGGCGCAH